MRSRGEGREHAENNAAALRSRGEGREHAKRTRRRPSFTLVELLVAMLIIAIVAGLGIYFYPTWSDKQRVVTATDLISGKLLIAKQQAKRDGVPIGVRFQLNGTGAAQFMYIQQPDPFAYGRCTGINGNRLTFTGVSFLDANEQSGKTGSAEAFLINLGDYIELFGGPVRQINAITNNSLTVVPSTTPLPSNLPTGANVDPTQPNYRIYPAPRPMAGEQPMVLPNNVVVNFAAIGNGNNNPKTNLSPRVVFNVTGGTATQYDILFSPSGSVLYQSNPDGQIFLWVEDTTAKTNAVPVLIAVQLRTGFIATHPVAPGADPYAYARDGRSSGL
jgi:prepilin-type N-terminal cleavage/methylation domain-containing protein